jgi:hypothetical protein
MNTPLLYIFQPFTRIAIYLVLFPHDGLHYLLSSFIHSGVRLLPALFIPFFSFLFRHSSFCCFFRAEYFCAILTLSEAEEKPRTYMQSIGIWDLRSGVYHSQEAGTDSFLPGTTVFSCYSGDHHHNIPNRLIVPFRTVSLLWILASWFHPGDYSDPLCWASDDPAVT